MMVVRILLAVGQVVQLQGDLRGQEMEIDGLGSKGMPGQNFAHLWIIIAMIMGNIGFFLLKRKRAKEEEESL